MEAIYQLKSWEFLDSGIQKCCTTGLKRISLTLCAPPWQQAIGPIDVSRRSTLCRSSIIVVFLPSKQEVRAHFPSSAPAAWLQQRIVLLKDERPSLQA